MIVKGSEHISSILLFDSELSQIKMSALDGIFISEVADTLFDGQYLFALDLSQNLIAMDLDLLCKGFKPYTIIKFE